MLILGIILFGMIVGAGAQLILGGSRAGVDWTMAIAAGLIGSFLGGLVISLLSGDGLDLQPSGIIGSLAGAIVVTAGWSWWNGRHTPTRATGRAEKRSGDPAHADPVGDGLRPRRPHAAKITSSWRSVWCTGLGRRAVAGPVHIGR